MEAERRAKQIDDWFFGEEPEGSDLGINYDLPQDEECTNTAGIPWDLERSLSFIIKKPSDH